MAERIRETEAKSEVLPKFEAEQTEFLEQPEAEPKQNEQMTGEGFQFQFPCGYIDDEGAIHKGFNVSPMTGRVRKEIAKPENRRNGGRAITTMLKLCISEIEGLSEVTEEVLKRLTVADRDYAT